MQGIKIIAASSLLAAFIMSGCVPESDSVDGHDLSLAYARCIGVDDDLIANRVACTQAAYGGN